MESETEATRPSEAAEAETERHHVAEQEMLQSQRKLAYRLLAAGAAASITSACLAQIADAGRLIAMVAAFALLMVGAAFLPTGVVLLVATSSRGAARGRSGTPARGDAAE